MSEALRDRVFETSERILRRERVGSARAAIASFLLGLYARDKRLTETDVEFELGALVEETLAAYEQLTGKKHRLVRGLYVRVDGADEQGPFDRLSVTGDKLMFGKRGDETVLAVWRSDRNRWEPPGQPGSATGNGVEVYAATARPDHFEIVATSGLVIGCCSEAGQAGVLAEEPGVRFRLVEPELCQNCREQASHLGEDETGHASVGG